MIHVENLTRNFGKLEAVHNIHFSTVMNLVVLVAVSAALVCVGAWRFSRIEV